MNEKVMQLVKQIRLNIGLYSVIVSVIGLIGRLILYCYQVGYYYYFNVNINKIDIISGNIVFQLLIYTVLAGLLFFFNLLGYGYYKKGKLIWYLGCFVLVFFILCSVFVLKISQELPSFDEILRTGFGIFLISLTVTFVFHVIIIAYTLYPSVKDQIERTEMKLKKEQNKGKKGRLQKKLNQLNEANTSTEKPNNFSDLPTVYKVSLGLGLVCACFISFLCIGYVSASSKREFKTISNDYITVEHECYRDGFAVVFEDDNEYIVVPYECTEEEVVIYLREQMTVEEKNLFTVEKSFEKVVCKIEE